MKYKARSLALLAHHGQVDKGGRDYMIHVDAVAQAVAHLGADYETVALLHDVIEDTTCTLADLKAEGYPAEVIDGVDAMSRRAGESWKQYILRARQNPLARMVKLADLTDNLDEGRLESVPDEKAATMRMMYSLAREWLRD